MSERNAGGANQWGIVQRLTGDRRSDGGLFGESIDLNGPFLVIGAPFERDFSGQNAGVAYSFKRDALTGQFEQIRRFDKGQVNAFGQFGQSVAIGGDTILVGAPQEELTGAVYFFGPNLQSGDPVPGVAGVENTLQAVCATPDERTWFVAGFVSGFANLDICPNSPLNIERPQLIGSAVADRDGIVQISGVVSEQFAGRSVLLQAVELATCTVSNLVEFQFVQ